MAIENPGSNVENYLGVMIGQEGASLPPLPSSRIEEYLKFFVDNNVGKVTQGYFYNNVFYKDAAHTQLITPLTNCFYVDLTAGGLYYYNGTAYVAVSSSGGGLEFAMAWDGTTAPDVTKIPAGIVVTYNGTSYTGTLAASEDTKGGIYLVHSTGSTPDVYDEYVTVGETTYSWERIGRESVVSVNGQNGAVVLRGTDIQMSSNDTTTLKAAIDGKEKLIPQQSTPPSNPSVGDLWLDTSEEGGSVPFAISFNKTLASASWSNNAITIADEKFLVTGYVYIVSPSSQSYSNYATAGIYADDVTTAGNMTLHCTTTPSSDITLNIIRVRADNG